MLFISIHKFDVFKLFLLFYWEFVFSLNKYNQQKRILNLEIYMLYIMCYILSVENIHILDEKLLIF